VDDTNARVGEAADPGTGSRGAASVIGSACETRSAWVERNSVSPGSATTAITVLGDGVRGERSPRNSGLTSPISVPRTSPARSTRAQRERARGPAGARSAQDQREAGTEVVLIRGRERRRLLERAEDGDVRAVIARELERDESLAREQVEAGVEHPVRIGLVRTAWSWRRTRGEMLLSVASSRSRRSYSARPMALLA
jgi:hypothetical protein